MRNAFADEMTRLCATNQKPVLLSGDIGNKLFDKLKEAAPDQFFTNPTSDRAKDFLGKILSH